MIAEDKPQAVPAYLAQRQLERLWFQGEEKSHGLETRTQSRAFSEPLPLAGVSFCVGTPSPAIAHLLSTCSNSYKTFTLFRGRRHSKPRNGDLELSEELSDDCSSLQRPSLHDSTSLTQILR